MFFPHPRDPRPRWWLVSVPLLTLLVLFGAAPAQADSPEEGETRVGMAEYYAGLLSEEPEGEAVIVDDSLAGLYDLAELEGDLRRTFGALDVPYYVVASALPGSSTVPRDFLAAVQDRVAEPGLYVYLRPGTYGVTAVSRGVNLPVERADRVLTRDGALHTYLPMQAKAEAFVQTLTAPDLDQRYEERWGSSLRTLGPVYWWAETKLRELRLETYNGPARLGEMVGLVVGLSLTLAVVLTSTRAGRRTRAAQAGYTGRLFGDRALVVGAVLSTATGAAVLVASLIHLDSATLPEDVEHVAPVPPETAPYVVDTVRVERVAQALREDPLYVDPQAEVDVRGLAEAAERELPEDVPVHVAVLPMNTHDESGGDGEIFAHALHHVMGEDGFFVVVYGRSEATQVETARFGVGFADQGRDWSHLGEVTGYLQDTSPERALNGVLDVVEGEMVAAPGEASEVPYSVESRANPSPDPSRTSRFFSGGFYESLFLAGPIIAAVLVALVWLVGRVAARMRTAPGRALRPRADRAVRRMTKALRAAPAHHPGRDEALRESDIALTVLAGRPDELDLVGITVVADRVVLRLDPDPRIAARAEEPVCMVDPLHGPSVLHRAGGRKNDERVVVFGHPVCAACSALTESRRRDRTLRVAASEGGRVPHLEVDREWVRSGYGAKYRLDVEELLKESDVR